MSKLLSINIAEEMNGLVVQELDLTSEGNIIEVKGAVGSRKTTFQDSIKLGIEGGIKKGSGDDTLKYPKFDNEVCVLSAQKIFKRTWTDKNGEVKSSVYQKTDDNKISKDPIINGKKMTPAVFRDTLTTELTFGAGRFISKDPREQTAFMMATYSHKLAALGVVFDKSAPNYINSILWRLEQAILFRADKEFKKKQLNGFKGHLEAEGYDEQNIPALVDLVGLNAEIAVLNMQKITAETAHNSAISQAKIDKIATIQIEIDKLAAKGSALMGKITAYNEGLETAAKLRRAKLEREIGEDKQKTDDLNDAKCLLLDLFKLGYDGQEVQEWIDKMPDGNDKRNFEEESKALPPLLKVPITENKITDFTKNYTIEINQALIDLEKIKRDIQPLIESKKTPIIDVKDFDPAPYNTEAIDAQIVTAKATNLINERWMSFQDHQEADEKVKAIYKEYCELFTQVDLGVAGLSIQIVGDENKSEIRVFYNGCYNPALFGNLQQEDRLLSQYSETQRPIIAMLLQNYLLQEKINRGEDGLRAIFVEMPLDNATRLVMKQIKDEFDIDIFTSTTGDFDRESLEDGQFLIQNGQLLRR